MRAVVLVGGFGTRLRPLTSSIPNDPGPCTTIRTSTDFAVFGVVNLCSAKVQVGFYW